MASIQEQAVAIRAAMDAAGAVLTDEQAVESAALFPLWNGGGVEYLAGSRVRYGGQLYRCITGHTAQEGWNPTEAPSLWMRMDDPEIEWPVWRLPLGAHDAYALGAKVSHNGKHWTSTADGNVWEPGAIGAESLWTEGEKAT